jgi:hypothetical protein
VARPFSRVDQGDSLATQKEDFGVAKPPPQSQKSSLVAYKISKRMVEPPNQVERMVQPSLSARWWLNHPFRLRI